MKEYALYEGDTFITIGTIKELAELLGVKESTARFYTSPAWQKRKSQRFIICVEEEE